MAERLNVRQRQFEQACRLFSRQHNMFRLAPKLGLTPVTLRNKLNPEQPHVLKCAELVSLTELSDDPLILNSVLNGLKVVTTPPPSAAPPPTLTSLILAHALDTGELSRVLLSAGNDTLRRAQRDDMLYTAHMGIRRLADLIHRLQ
ncbi:phage regulatory CII family protein [Vibrio europaeus]|uniref:phage regulatory CII family protein n=1 Tax=Vibrio europaeus TaxID=300876 RepID=UPI00148CC8C4|nr:phage regulatory CII family protein [Vibrio europaeus]NOH22525.1 hypothetical protein [Vibrio europaeus]